MKFYHLDTSGTLSPGKIQVSSDAIFRGNAVTSSARLALRKLFPGGLSKFGISVLAASTRLEELNQQVTELLFEEVRRTMFPDCPSRLQSFFAAPSIDSIRNYWIQELRPEPGHFRLYECEADKVSALNAACLDQIQLYPLRPSSDLCTLSESTPGQPGPAVPLPPSCIGAAHEYWKSCRNSPKQSVLSDIACKACGYGRKMELLVQGEVHILRQIPLDGSPEDPCCDLPEQEYR